MLQAVRDKIAQPRPDEGARLLRRHAPRRLHGSAASATPGCRRSRCSATTPRLSARTRSTTCKAGRILAVFTVDVFNEGVDIPEVNTVLFLRPTESATVFLQQLGRGLRLAPDKAVLTALDFVGHHRTEFRFDQRYRALTGSTRARLHRDIEQGFPFLPSGTQIVLDRTDPGAGAGPRPQPGDDPAGPTSPPSCGGTRPTTCSPSWPSPASSWPTSSPRPTGPGLGCGARPGCPCPAVVRGRPQLLKRVRALAHVDDPDRAPHTCGGCPTTLRTMTAPARPTRPSCACSASRCGPTGVASLHTSRCSTPCAPSPRCGRTCAPSSVWVWSTRSM